MRSVSVNLPPDMYNYTSLVYVGAMFVALTLNPHIEVVGRCGDEKEQHNNPKDLINLGVFAL